MRDEAQKQIGPLRLIPHPSSPIPSAYPPPMIEALKSDEIVNKVGGRFRLTALIQKRRVELMKNARPLVERKPGMTDMEVVIQEILQDKITAELPDDVAEAV